jgi:hypothetical protein
MEYDDRERRDGPEGDARAPDEPVDPTTRPLQPTDASSTDASSTDATPSTDPAPDATARPESWPSEDATAREWQADSAPPADREAEAAWPTEPPAAGSGAADTWPTAAPERGSSPVIEPAADEPAPSEVEAYPAVEPDRGSWSDRPADRVDEAPPSEVEAYPAAPAAQAAMAAADTDATAAHSVPAAESATGESTQCPRCGTENRPGLAFCRNCGQRLVAAGVASTVERPGVPEGTQACARCGTHNRAGVAFCQNCGANLRGTAAGYVPPAAVDEEAVVAHEGRRGAILGPVVLLIGLIGIITAYLLPFVYGTGSLFERAFASGGYGASFWEGYPDVGASLADQAYFGLAAPAPLFGLLLLALAIAGFMRAVPGMLQTIGLGVALLWSAGLVILFVVVELVANWGGDIVGLLRDLSPAGIIFFLAGLIVLIGTLTRFGRS